MYFDEDGDLAHEFYEETIVTKNGQRKAKLKRIYKNLTPQVRKASYTCKSLPFLKMFQLISSESLSCASREL